MISPSLKIELSTMPSEPGVYQFFNKEDKIIYIGKAKNLKKRVSSYFQKNIGSRKTKNLVKNISEIKHIIVSSESDALLLENSLIKKYQPKYNILLRDDKTYPWIVIKNESFPRVLTTRRVEKDGSEYFGPFTNYKTVRTIMDIFSNLYSLRTCHYDLKEKNVLEKKYKVCLEYHIGNCLGGCEGHQEEKDYNIYISNIRDFLKGNLSSSINYFKNEMKISSKLLHFEKAQAAKEKIERLENYQSKSTVVSSKLNDIDVFSIISDSSHAYVNHLQVAFGRIVRFHNVEIKKKLDETDKELLLMTIVNLRDKFNSKNSTVITNIEFDKILNLKFIFPRAGDNKKLLDLSLRNATQFKIEKLKQVQIVDPERHTNRILNQMKLDLRLNEVPVHIECFDNSNIQGSIPVASCIVFKNCKPSKKDYRHFNIKTVEGPDDYASMEEVVFRRYKRMVEEKSVLPSLIIIDGGKGQLSSSIKALKKLNLENTIAILGIAKRLEEIFYPNDPVPLYLNKKSETLKVIQQMRNEAHRFAITLHRNKRSKQALTSSFDGIPGIGEKTKTALLKKFKSLKNIRETSLELLISEVGESKAKKLKDFLNSMN
ncbi:excinuclease ABC subunit UvrC [Flavobacteriaceae bacterium]|nr:excinuclease ABC subunit UvrC [Flavobacteriaceae bacterium]MDA9018646.1 excinuclease ABC subunit UvrC [Flavobacteriaceae bacterium]MDA9124601.1 excinuclease ABC subunit UvrC [Flavobacteriaceae bacterium]MDA9338573.1 excinuclease ABC subunit UvrC [Flavobacteriaceae bacterium]MDB3901029.1 excinuclease ABC subunit UvrC [Flavobacteriaceae bacterium]